MQVLSLHLTVPYTSTDIFFWPDWGRTLADLCVTETLVSLMFHDEKQNGNQDHSDFQYTSKLSKKIVLLWI